MDSRELRIGNLLDFGGGSSPINGGGIMLLSEGRLNVTPKPIPLTDDMLKYIELPKNLLCIQSKRYEGDERYYLHIDSDANCNNLNPYNGLKYLHKLQNLIYELFNLEITWKTQH